MRGKNRVAAVTLLVSGFAVSGVLAHANQPRTGGGYGYGYGSGYGAHVSGQCKPGWGLGDKDHCHSGPLGLLDNLLGQSSEHSGSGR